MTTRRFNTGSSAFASSDFAQAITHDARVAVGVVQSEIIKIATNAANRKAKTLFKYILDNFVSQNDRFPDRVTWAPLSQSWTKRKGNDLYWDGGHRVKKRTRKRLKFYLKTLNTKNLGKPKVVLAGQTVRKSLDSGSEKINRARIRNAGAQIEGRTRLKTRAAKASFTFYPRVQEANFSNLEKFLNNIGVIGSDLQAAKLAGGPRAPHRPLIGPVMNMFITQIIPNEIDAALERAGVRAVVKPSGDPTPVEHRPATGPSPADREKALRDI